MTSEVRGGRAALGIIGAVPLVLALVLVTLGAPALTADASSVTPTWIDGNQNCAAVTGTSEVLRLENGSLSNGTYAAGGGSITISNLTDYSFDWSSSGVLISAVFVKAGNGGWLYNYLPSGATSDTGLSSGDHAISHITFCAGGGVTTTTTEDTTTTTEDTTTTTTEDTTTTTTEDTTTTTTEGTTTTTEGTTTTTDDDRPSPDRGRVTVVKEIVSGNPNATFEFTGDLSGTIGDGGTISESVPLDTLYISEEKVPDGWEIEDISCVADGGTFLIGLDSVSMTVTEDGGEVTCTFRNGVSDEVAGTTITVAPTTVPGTLPFTGFGDGSASMLALLLVGLGSLALVGSRALREEGDA